MNSLKRFGTFNEPTFTGEAGAGGGNSRFRSMNELTPAARCNRVTQMDKSQPEGQSTGILSPARRSMAACIE